jgi:hypothetical protein
VLSDNKSIRNFDYPQACFFKRQKFRGDGFQKMELSGMKGYLKANPTGFTFSRIGKRDEVGGQQAFQSKIWLKSQSKSLKWSFGYCKLPIGHCKLPIGHCELPIGHCKLPIGHCKLPIGYCKLPIGHCELPIGYCKLPIGHCRLPIGHCRLPIGHCELPIGHCRPQFGYFMEVYSKLLLELR